jgi:hypothetical protein
MSRNTAIVLMYHRHTFLDDIFKLKHVADIRVSLLRIHFKDPVKVMYNASLLLYASSIQYTSLTLITLG